MKDMLLLHVTSSMIIASRMTLRSPGGPPGHLRLRPRVLQALYLGATTIPEDCSGLKMQACVHPKPKAKQQLQRSEKPKPPARLQLQRRQKRPRQRFLYLLRLYHLRPCLRRLLRLRTMSSWWEAAPHLVPLLPHLVGGGLGLLETGTPPSAPGECASKTIWRCAPGMPIPTGCSVVLIIMVASAPGGSPSGILHAWGRWSLWPTYTPGVTRLQAPGVTVTQNPHDKPSRISLRSTERH